MKDHGFDLSSLNTRWPSSVVARNKISEFSGGLISPGTLANEDSRGTGPKGRFIIGRKVGYPVQSVVEWLEARMKKESPQNPSAMKK